MPPVAPLLVTLHAHLAPHALAELRLLAALPQILPTTALLQVDHGTLTLSTQQQATLLYTQEQSSHHQAQDQALDQALDQDQDLEVEVEVAQAVETPITLFLLNTLLELSSVY